jgi:homoserine dehydrogenase
MSANLAILGLGTVGGEFLREILRHRDKGINVVCVSEMANTEGKKLARDSNIEIVTLDGIIAKADAVDMIFDLTGSSSVRRALRDKLASSGNKHTVVVPETVSHLVWGLMTNQHLPKPSDHHPGY